MFVLTSFCSFHQYSTFFDSEDWKWWSFKIGGTFRLSKHDEKFDDYLKSLDIPQFAIEMIKSAKEIIQVVEPTQTNPNWTLKMSTGVNLHSILNMLRFWLGLISSYCFICFIYVLIGAYFQRSINLLPSQLEYFDDFCTFGVVVYNFLNST